MMNGPQIDVPVGVQATTSSASQQQPGWNGLTIKEILDKVDLFNVTVDNDGDETKNEKVLVSKQNQNKASSGTAKTGTVINAADPEAAFLGPKLWDKPLPLPSLLDDTDFSIMNIDDFLNENNINLDEEEEQPQQPQQEKSRVEKDTKESDAISAQSSTRRQKSNSISKDVPADFLYAESKRARLEREKAEKKRKLELEVEFAPEDLALATIPGADFDPRKRSFSTDELKPQPIIRKRKKQFVPSESKDDRYWEKRVKNNIAARRSREARRLKENQIALRAAFLERENTALKEKLDNMTAENERLVEEKKSLLERLAKYEEI